ncbi:MAG: hypothetical protein Q8T09_02800 [Candidatus Melainabacteria bacterium]|nr:hypothetical protein [Candidatus Melainabacteria bacterium]
MMEEPTIYEQQTNTQAKAIDLRAELAKLSATEGNLNGSQFGGFDYFKDAKQKVEQANKEKFNAKAALKEVKSGNLIAAFKAVSAYEYWIKDDREKGSLRLNA